MIIIMRFVLKDEKENLICNIFFSYEKVEMNFKRVFFMIENVK